MNADDGALGAGGVKALQSERDRVKQLTRQLATTQKERERLRAKVITLADMLVDVVEQDGGQRDGR